MRPSIRGSSAGQLVASIRGQIDAGALLPGEVLPSIRSLAADLGVNRNTVAAAYAQLAAAGVVETRRRGGTVVLGVPAVEGEGFASAPELVNLASGNPDAALLPRITGDIVDRFQLPLYGAAAILPELHDWADRHLVPEVEGPHRLVLTHGSVDAVERLLSAHLTRGDAVAMEDPCFLSSLGILRLGGYQLAPVPMDHEGMTVDGLAAALAAGARAVVCTPRAHNPTGTSLTADRATALRAVLAQHPGVLVIEDDHFSMVSSQPYLRITPPDASRWALVRSVSKFLGPDLRVAFVLTDSDTGDRLGSRLSSATTWVSHLLQHIVEHLLRDPATVSLLASARRTYVDRSGQLISALAEHDITVHPRVDGLNVWIPLAAGTTAVVDELARAGWAVRRGSSFSSAAQPAPAIRVTTATLTADQASRFAADLAPILHR